MIDIAVTGEIQRLTEWVTLLSKIVVLIGGVLGAFWAYIKFVLEKGLLPPIEFDVGCKPAGVLNEWKVVEVILRLKNAGSSTLICHNLRLDVLYILGESDKYEARLERDPNNPLFGRLLFPHSLAKDDLRLTTPIRPPTKPHAKFRPWLRKLSLGLVRVSKFIGRVKGWVLSLFFVPPPQRPAKKGRGFLVLKIDTFVQPAVSQAYTFVTRLPENTSHVLIWASFEYGVRPQFLQRVMLRIGRILGLIQYSLTHVYVPHTSEHVFDLRTTQAENTVARRE